VGLHRLQPPNTVQKSCAMSWPLKKFPDSVFSPTVYEAYPATKHGLGEGYLERREPELIPAVLHPEYAEKVAVHAQQNAAPDEDGDLLGLRVLYTRHLERKRDGSKGQNAV
jgi:hypothetical protein